MRERERERERGRAATGAATEPQAADFVGLIGAESRREWYSLSARGSSGQVC